MNTSDRFVILPGLIVPIEPHQLLNELEARGLRFRVDGDELVVVPCGRLTDVDRDAIRRWKWHLLALVEFCENARPA